MDGRSPAALDRRGFIGWLAAAGVAAAAVPQRLWAWVQERRRITRETVAAAEALHGLEFTDAERELMLESLNERLALYEQLRSVAVPNSVPPAVQFDPVLPGTELPTERTPFRMGRQPRVSLPAKLDEAAFLPVTQLSELVRTRQLSAVELTRMYVDRLHRHGAALECVITLTEERALERARRADEEIAVGRYRGPLHGIPWGTKDLMATRGYPTTWGTAPYKDQRFDYDASVVRRLDDAGAVLVAKLTSGELAQGDLWFGGRTRNPWKPEDGSGGSSAGPASATAAGLVGFSLGTETMGSILGPSARCGATGLRPTFGRVSRHGVMALSWSMDKVGAICRSVEDCAVVLNAIHGPDGLDPTVRDVPFNWNPDVRPSDLRVGYLESAFQDDDADRGRDLEVLDVLRSLGAKLIPLELPQGYPIEAIRLFVLDPEEGAAFDDLTRSNRDEFMLRQGPNDRPDRFRKARLIPGVEYLMANRVRTMLMGSMRSVMEGVDVLVAPARARNLSAITNLTGHPAVAVPSGFRDDGTPASMSFVGELYREDAVLALAKAYQDATAHHLRHPPRFV
ncbi:MAG: amidase [Gemmatimonadetes bacterium]|nr:amidase [Gemmatimonadota bacterium]